MLGPKLQAVYDRYSREYGWGDPGKIPDSGVGEKRRVEEQGPPVSSDAVRPIEEAGEPPDEQAGYFDLPLLPDFPTRPWQ